MFWVFWQSVSVKLPWTSKSAFAISPFFGGFGADEIKSTLVLTVAAQMNVKFIHPRYLLPFAFALILIGSDDLSRSSLPVECSSHMCSDR